MKSYHTFLVRCWYETPAPPDQLTEWRFLVSEIGTEAVAPLGFAEYDAMVRFLAAQLLAEGGRKKPPVSPADMSGDEVNRNDES